MPGSTDDCISDEEIRVEDGQAIATFTVADGCEVNVTLASHEKPDAEFSRDDVQPLHDANTSTFGPGTHTLVVDLPGNATDEETAGAMTGPSRYAPLAGATSLGWLALPFAFVGIALRRTW